MSILLTACSRCKKSFDFELYSGLCPHCGCFHRAPGQTLNGTPLAEPPKTVARAERGTVEANYERHIKMDKLMGVSHYDHKDSKPDPHERQMARAVSNSRNNTGNVSRTNYTGKAKRSSASGNGKGATVISRLLVAIIAIAMLFNFLSDMGLLDKIKEIVADEISMDRSVEPYDLVEYGDTSFEVYTAYSLSNSQALRARYGMEVPEGKQLVAVSIDLYYSGEQPYEGEKAMPVILERSGGDASLLEPLSPKVYTAVARDYEIDDVMIDADTVYSAGDYVYGYLFYLVDQKAETIELQIPCIKDGKVARKYNAKLAVEGLYDTHGYYEDYSDDAFQMMPDFGNYK